MLPAAYRMRTSSDFAQALRIGRRARCGGLVVYLAPGDTGHVDDVAKVVAGPQPAESAAPHSRVGLVVGKSVGGSVVRHAVSRRLRAPLAGRLAALPAGSRVVVRALPPAAGRSSDQLGRDLDQALAKLSGGAR
jgi:ribonuclease P protein component